MNRKKKATGDNTAVSILALGIFAFIVLTVACVAYLTSVGAR